MYQPQCLWQVQQKKGVYKILKETKYIYNIIVSEIFY